MLTAQALIYALTTAVIFSAFALLSRVLSVKSENPLAFSAVYGFLGVVFSIPIFFIEPWEFSQITPTVLVITFLATIFFGIFEGTEFFARKYLEASRSTVFFQITPIITFIGSVLFLQEGVSQEKLIAIALIIVGNIIAVYKHGGHVTAKGLFFILSAVISLGMAYVADKAVFEHYPLGFYMFITYFFPSLYILLFIRNGLFSKMKRELVNASWRLPILGLLSVSGYYMVLKTFEITEASVAIPVIYTSTILTSIGGIVVLKERSNIAQKLIGALFVVAGVSLL